MDPEQNAWTRRHLLGMDGLARHEIGAILDSAQAFRDVNYREVKKVPTLRGKTVINLFYENSTRTRTSFELAGKRMSADVINISASSSSAAKGETLLDTMATLQAMRPDVVVLRHGDSGAPHFLTRHLDAGIVNAGDGQHEHPTQSLLDLLTIQDHLEEMGKTNFEGMNVAICGDVLHSRVARSNAFALRTLGANVRFVGPPTLMPSQAEKVFDIKVHHNMEEGLEEVDVIIMLRLQLERMTAAYLPSVREYFEYWGLTRERLELTQPHALVMHPGPINRGVEIASDVADNPNRSVILEQVANGLAVRMAVLYHLCTGAARNAAQLGESA
ncbi:aspartate carbamoyltransferase catalytic subunit [Magnetococcus sp. PR-3]|uniref:aspartate carbamoyltransferase catalytic subunit n=1 Tax=Magnetococcus sp. PR-3 TaxID=3120355 RepID=UPI002FCDF253